MTAQACGAGLPAQLADEALDALVAAGEAVVVDQVLPDGLGVAALAERELDEVAVGLAGAGRGAAAGSGSGARVGGHLVGRFWICRGSGTRWPVLRSARVGGHLVGRFCRRPAAPTARRPDGDAGGLQVGAGGFPADAGFLLDAPQRPAQPPQRDDLLSLLFAQDIAHVDGGYPSVAVNVLPQFRWPVFSCPSLAGFGCPPRFCALRRSFIAVDLGLHLTQGRSARIRRASSEPGRTAPLDSRKQARIMQHRRTRRSTRSPDQRPWLLVDEGAQHQAQDQSDILDVRGAAKLLRCSPSHVSNILNGKVSNLPPIPHVRAGRLRLIRREALDEWFRAQEAASLAAIFRC